jgi:hypothetical protein
MEFSEFSAHVHVMVRFLRRKALDKERYSISGKALRLWLNSRNCAWKLSENGGV